MTGTPLTPEELAWISANPDAVRVLMSGTRTTPTEPVPPLLDPVAETADYLVKAMKKIMGSVETDLERSRKPLARYMATMESPSADAEARAFAKEMLEENGPEYKQKIAVCERHIEALRRKLEILQTDPLELLLPIGTVVKFVGVPEHANSQTLSDQRRSYPLPGTVGVVTSLSRTSEFPLGVSVRDSYQDGWGQSYGSDYERFQTFHSDIGMFEVIGYSLLPNGEEYRGYGFHQTHIGSLDSKGEERKEMVLEGNGYFWRLHDFGGTQGIEALQAFDAMDEMSWIEGVVEEYRTPVSPAQKTPSPK